MEVKQNVMVVGGSKVPVYCVGEEQKNVVGFIAHQCLFLFPDGEGRHDARGFEDRHYQRLIKAVKKKHGVSHVLKYSKCLARRENKNLVVQSTSEGEAPITLESLDHIKTIFS